MTIDIPPPQLQVDFALALEQIRATYLQDALSAAAASLDTATIDSELARFVPGDSLSQLAGHGLRGELMFAVPCVLRKNPRLLGYYRLLLGFSQKAFYGIAGVGQFRSMENSGRLNKAQEHALSSLCSALTAASAALLDGIGARRISRELLDDLALLTVRPQLRGGYNVRAGTAGIVRVFDAIAAIISHAAAKTEPQLIELKNAAGRRVSIQFASDPDIRIQEEMAAGSLRNIIAIEVKAGVDFSNIHNRIGEAEKSHQKAKADGYVERWTVVNVDRMDMTMARRESPSTDRFYRLSQIDARTGEEYQDFFNKVIALTGIIAPPGGAAGP
ncbi:MAG TPA: XcyI family restriction endonuclease [Candidatus Binatus sp.]|nr:XcyI family restriction endonuclease [Candidatus Binatus sp.]